MQQFATVQMNTQITSQIYHMRLSAPEIVAQLQAGHFVHLLCRDAGVNTDPLLRRPLSVAVIDKEAGTCDLLYQVVGRGSAALSRLSEGASLDLLGPLGKPYPLPTASGQRIALVAGGIGIPPLYPLAEQLLAAGHSVVLYLGARSADLLLMEADFSGLKIPVHLSTDDGSAGQKGRVSDGLGEELVSEKIDLVYSCGPLPLLKAVQGILELHRIPGWLSLETHMGCGIGACLGCTVRIRRGQETQYALLCQDGPAFAAGEVVFDA